MSHEDKHFSVVVSPVLLFSLFFFFNDTATPEIYTLSLHDALPISPAPGAGAGGGDAHRQPGLRPGRHDPAPPGRQDRKSTRLNSSHEWISYAVFCLKKKKTTCNPHTAARQRRVRLYTVDTTR